MDRRQPLWSEPSSSPGPWPVLQSCNEACAGFQRLPQAGWSDYGWCNNPLSPRHGAPVLAGRECPYAVPLTSLREA